MDPVQEKLLDEMCIVVDRNDKAIGARSKRDCHLMENISKGLLHRAFSAFVFNSKGELLMQQRSQSKITFPGCYTNTCCSHPLHVEGEKEETEAIGVKRAVRRRLQQELGIPPEQVPLEGLQHMTRIHYQAPSGEGTWGEHEVDYIVFFQGDVSLNPDPNEVATVKWLRKEDLQDFLDRGQAKGHQDYELTPWFSLISQHFLPRWWEQLHQLDALQDHSTIHRLL